MPRTKRKDKSRAVLRTGESQRADGTYQFRWTDSNHKRFCVYAKTLDELRYKEEQIKKDKSDGIKTEARYTTVNEVYELWKELKRGLKNNTFENYKYMYETFVRHQIGSKTVSSLKKTDIKRFYNYLTDERQLKPSTIDSMKKFVNAEEGAIIYGISKSRIIVIAREAGAVYKVGNSALINTELFEKYLERFREPARELPKHTWNKLKEMTNTPKTGENS